MRTTARRDGDSWILNGEKTWITNGSLSDVAIVLYSLYALLRPAISAMKAGGAAADAGVGFLNGVLGGITGLAGILVIIW